MKLIISTLFLVFSFLSQGQTEKKITPQYIPTNIERYGLDYELKDYTFLNGDSTVLNQLDLTSVENLRNQHFDTEVIDSATGLTIVLFHAPEEFIKPSKIKH